MRKFGIVSGPFRTPRLAVRLVALLAPGLVVVAMACSGDAVEEVTAPEISPSSPIIENLLSKMAGLSSYHVTITASARSQDPLRTGRTELDFVAPDLYRVVASEADGETKDVCTTDTRGRTCRVVLATVTGNAIGEAVWNGKARFLRACRGVIEACSGAWQETPNRNVFTPGAGPLQGADMPNWHVEALTAARDLVLVEGEGTAGALLHYQGRFNPIRAFNEAARKFLGDEVFSDEGCAIGVVDLPPDATPDVNRECGARGITVKEFVEAYDLTPTPIDIWVSSTDSTVQRILAVVPELPGYPEITVELVFSQFNAVEIEFPPEE